MPQARVQCAIAAFLDRETARIDALIAQKERLLALLGEKRQALVSHAVTKGLDPDAPMKESGNPHLGAIPAAWDVQSLKRVSPKLTVGVVVNPSTYFADEGIPFLHGVDIHEGWIDLTAVKYLSTESNEQLRKSKLRAGDIVAMRVGEPGISAVIPPSLEGCNCASLLIIRGAPTFDSDWLEGVLNSKWGKFQFKRLQNGAAQEQINVSDAVNLQVPVPPLQEQHAIAQKIRESRRIHLELASKLSRSRELLRERRQSLITTAVTGQLDPSVYMPQEARA